MKSDIRVALAIFNAPVGNAEGNLFRTEQWIKKAAEAGADIVCFPEAHLTGYSNRKDIIQHAEAVPGPSSQALSQLSIQLSITILAGIAEKGNDGLVYASHMVLTADGETGVYRKLHISPREKDAFAPGNAIPLFTIKDAVFGIQLCYDAHFPELSTAMAAQRADIVFIPHASPRATSSEKLASWMRHLPARAYDNSVYILACNQTGANGEGLEFPGLALAIAPTGKVLKQDLSGKEGLLIIDLSADELNAVRSNTMHYFLPNRRPQLYQRQQTTRNQLR